MICTSVMLLVSDPARTKDLRWGAPIRMIHQGDIGRLTRPIRESLACLICPRPQPSHSPSLLKRNQSCVQCASLSVYHSHMHVIKSFPFHSIVPRAPSPPLTSSLRVSKISLDFSSSLSTMARISIAEPRGRDTSREPAAQAARTQFEEHRAQRAHKTN